VTQFNCGQHPLYRNSFCGADATTVIRRSEWGINGYSGLIGDEVRLDIGVEAFPE